MPLKRSTRNSNNTSINTNNGVNDSKSGNTGSNNVAENEGKGKKQKNNPYYSWW